MIYLVDIGNTRLKYIALTDNLSKTENEKLSVKTEINSIFSADISKHWLVNNWGNASKIIIASVNQKSQIEMLRLWAEEQSIEIDIIESSECAHGVSTGYRHFEQLGVDRWLALIGAHHYYANKNIIVIDAGTATTVDVLMSNGQHIGGWIVPGVKMMQQSIIQGTANVITEDLSPSSSFGDLTVNNVSNGCWAATLGLVTLAQKQIICSEKHQAIDDIVIVFTGGNGKALYQLHENVNQLNSQFDSVELKNAKKTSHKQLQHYNSELIFHGLKQYV